MNELVAMFVHRPYVIGFLAAFVVLSWAERGVLRAVLWLVTGTFIGWLSEFCSVNTGVPFGNYVYHAEQFDSELWLGAVPLFASISFAFMSYFAYSAARRLLAPWRGSGLRMSTPNVEALDGSPRTLVLAAVIATWMDTVIDPLTLVGRYWFLGDLYHYDPPGAHFGVPFSNYVGWVLTVGAIVFANQMVDRALVRGGVRWSRGPELPFEPFWGIGCCGGVFAFILSINLVLLISGRVPPDVPLGSIFASGVAISGAFFVFAALMIRRGLAVSAPAPALAQPS